MGPLKTNFYSPLSKKKGCNWGILNKNSCSPWRGGFWCRLKAKSSAYSKHPQTLKLNQNSLISIKKQKEFFTNFHLVKSCIPHDLLFIYHFQTFHGISWQQFLHPFVHNRLHVKYLSKKEIQ